MLHHRLTHPEMLASLAAAGHGSQVLIADGHYPVSTGASRDATRVWLNLTADVPTVPQVLEVLLDSVTIEAAAMMTPPSSQPTPAVFAGINALLPMSPTYLERYAFYNAAMSSDVALVVATGERRVYGNVLLTIGVA